MCANNKQNIIFLLHWCFIVMDLLKLGVTLAINRKSLPNSCRLGISNVVNNCSNQSCVLQNSTQQFTLTWPRKGWEDASVPFEDSKEL